MASTLLTAFVILYSLVVIQCLDYDFDLDYSRLTAPLRLPVNSKPVSCQSGTYPPSSSVAPSVPSFVVNLDDPPEKRWNHVVQPFVNDIQEISRIVDRVTSYVPSRFLQLLKKKLKTLPAPIYLEIAAVSRAANVSTDAAVKINLLYELTTACTSIVARRKDGGLIHGRNLDYSLGDLKVTELLRKLTIDVDFSRGGKLLYHGTTYAGYVAILNGVKTDKFSVSWNQRFTGGASPLKNIAEWIKGKKKGWPMALVSRQLFEKEANSFNEAKNYLEKVPLLSPVYFIVGGVRGNEGCVITRSSNKSLNPTCLSADRSWVLETNYDHWKPVPREDDRRTPANGCMKEKANATSFSTLFDVLGTEPVNNERTTYTSLMEVASGKLETYIRLEASGLWRINVSKLETYIRPEASFEVDVPWWVYLICAKVSLMLLIATYYGLKKWKETKIDLSPKQSFAFGKLNEIGDATIASYA